jgi:hypothetical protein
MFSSWDMQRKSQQFCGLKPRKQFSVITDISKHKEISEICSSDSSLSNFFYRAINFILLGWTQHIDHTLSNANLLDDGAAGYKFQTLVASQCHSFI